MSRFLWIVQVLLALNFLFAGVFKLVSPDDTLATFYAHMPALFIRFIGVCETLGAIGLILPALLRIQPRLTPLAACGLVIIMLGATVLTPLVMNGDLVESAIPLVIGALAAFVAYGRARLAPIQPAARNRFRSQLAIQ